MEVAVPGSTYGRPLLCLYIDDQLIDQLGAEGITITDASSVRVATVFVQQSYTELACFRSFF